MFAFLIAYLIKMNLAIERIWLSNFQADSLLCFQGDMSRAGARCHLSHRPNARCNPANDAECRAVHQPPWPRSGWGSRRISTWLPCLFQPVLQSIAALPCQPPMRQADRVQKRHDYAASLFALA